MSAFRFDGKAALVTGAGRGIGAAIATRLAEAGAAVMLANRSLDAAEELAAALRARGLRAQAIPFTADETGCRAAVVKTVEAFGGLQVLVHNAGAAPGRVWTRSTPRRCGRRLRSTSRAASG
ncbi:hypothetical protein MASR1M6_18390 [Rubrivivax sp.]